MKIWYWRTVLIQQIFKILDSLEVAHSSLLEAITPLCLKTMHRSLPCKSTCTSIRIYCYSPLATRPKARVCLQKQVNNQKKNPTKNKNIHSIIQDLTPWYRLLLYSSFFSDFNVNKSEKSRSKDTEVWNRHRILLPSYFIWLSHVHPSWFSLPLNPHLELTVFLKSSHSPICRSFIWWTYYLLDFPPHLILKSKN